MAAKLKVVAQKADPQAAIKKSWDGRRFETNIINVMEDGTEQPHRLTCDRKKDIVKKLEKLPIENVRGMETDGMFVSIELFAYNGV